jgi:hypothetical protein
VTTRVNELFLILAGLGVDACCLSMQQQQLNDLCAPLIRNRALINKATHHHCDRANELQFYFKLRGTDTEHERGATRATAVILKYNVINSPSLSICIYF